MPTKNLLIKSSKGKSALESGKWHVFEQPKNYIEAIDTGDISKNLDAATLNVMISGVPSGWARAKLFGMAFNYAVDIDPQVGETALIKFYKMLLDEWKGLIGLMAIHATNITLSPPIYLQGADANNLFDLKATLGHILFDDVDLWCNPEALATRTIDSHPFIQLIYYNGNLIGGFSPYSLIFTAANYGDISRKEVPWFENDKLQNPLNYLDGTKNKDALQKLYILVKNIEKHLRQFELDINKNRGEKTPYKLTSLTAFVKQWAAEIYNKNRNIIDEGTIDGMFSVGKPYYNLFNIKRAVYFDYRRLLSQAPTDGSDYIEIDTKDFLLQGDSVIRFTQTDYDQPLSKSAVHYLTATLNNETYYFSIPLSDIGLFVFQKELGGLLGQKTDYHQLNAELTRDDNDNLLLTVHLRLYINNSFMPAISRKYKVAESVWERRVILWPNFYSAHWNLYYLYSEIPGNTIDTIRTKPVFKNADPDELIYIDVPTQLGTVKQLLRETNQDKNLLIDNLIVYPTGIVDSSSHKYEVYKSTKPIAGIELISEFKGKVQTCGFLITKTGEVADSKQVKNLTHDNIPRDGAEAKVGIDFGSNNSCISYSILRGVSSEPVKFKSRRVMFIGNEVVDPNSEKLADLHELLFFQNEEPNNGQIKSWIQQHDQRYVPNHMKSAEIAGGTPVFEPNLDVLEVESEIIRTRRGQISHNLKWRNDDYGMNFKKGYIKTLWMAICAELYAIDSANVPKKIELMWAHPSALNRADVYSYNAMYRELKQLNAISGATIDVKEPMTESEAVCNYAIYKGGVAIHPDNMMLGIDVGGSTSDILMVANYQGKLQLVQQSSIRLAANKLSVVAQKSEAVRKALRHFVDSSKSIRIKHINNMETTPSTAPYFLNLIFDRLPENDFETFYGQIYQSPAVQANARPMFAVPAYISGILLFYSGQLIAHTLQQLGISSVNTFDLFPFGKGGRIFDWLSSFLTNSRVTAYYEACLKAGMGDAYRQGKINFNHDRKNIKSEVSFGLSSTKDVEKLADTFNDLIGEAGFTYQNETLQVNSELKIEHFKNLPALTPPAKFEQFEKFLNIYFETGRETGYLTNIDPLRAKLENLKADLTNYIMNDVQFIAAKSDMENFSYNQPLIILAAMCYLDRHLIPTLFPN